MKDRIGLVLVFLVAAHGVADAELDFHGILNTGSHPVVIDSVFMATGGVPGWFSTPDWSGDSAVTDSFDFPMIRSWPSELMILGAIDGEMLLLQITPVQPDSWYVLGDVTPVKPRVMFWTAGGVEEQHQGAIPQPALRVYPAVVVERATIEAQVFSAGQVRLDMFDAAGNRVRTFGSVDRNAGVFSAVWRGEDDSGQRLPGGIYFCRLAAGDAATVRKVLLAR